MYIDMCSIESTEAIGKISRVFRVVSDIGGEGGVRGRQLYDVFILTVLGPQAHMSRVDLNTRDRTP